MDNLIKSPFARKVDQMTLLVTTLEVGFAYNTYIQLLNSLPTPIFVSLEGTFLCIASHRPSSPSSIKRAIQALAFCPAVDVHYLNHVFPFI